MIFNAFSPIYCPHLCSKVNRLWKMLTSSCYWNFCFLHRSDICNWSFLIDKINFPLWMQLYFHKYQLLRSFVCQSAKPLNSLKSSSFVLHSSSLITVLQQIFFFWPNQISNVIPSFKIDQIEHWILFRKWKFNPIIFEYSKIF